MLQNPAPTRSPAMAQPGFRRELDPDQQDQQGQQDHQHMDQNQQDHRGQQDHQHMDFFGKLGYSPGEVKAALQRLGLSTDVNSVLGELVGSTAPHHQLPSHPIADSDRRSTGRKDLGLRLSRAPGAHGLAVLSAPPPQPPAPPLAPAAQTRNGRDTEDELKAVVIDGSNVAMSHGNKEVFSCQGILLAVNYFLVRGHTTVTVFVPSWRKEQPRPDAPITEQHILTELEKRKLLVFTPSRRVGGKRVVCYDDRFIVKLAHESDGVIVSNDTYRDLQAERPEWRKCIEERLLMYSFVNDKFMPPDDPLGRYGPNLDDFLRKKPLASEQNRPLCPYDKKCTYGIKCKFYHPERAQQSYSSLADELRERARTSAGKLESTGAVSPRGPHRDPSLTPDLRFLDCDMEHRSSPEQRHSACPAPRVTENALVCRDDSCRTAQNHAVGSPARVRAQKGWPSPARCAQSSLSQDRLDSGLGSYESPFSDSQLLWSRPQQPPPHLSEPDGARPVCGCCPPVAPPPGAPRHCSSTSLGSCSRAQYDTFSPYTVYTPSMHHFYSLPGLLQHGGQQHGRQPNFWSDPFNAPPKAMSPPPGGPGCSYRDPGSPLWAPPGQCPVTVHPERLELRKKLQAIFNPCQVDAVMEMFPNLTDAQTLAAEILKLRAQRGF